MTRRKSMPGLGRSNKYGAIPTVIDGIRFASKREAYRYQTLKLLVRGGKITGLKLQPSYPIVINGQLICTVKLDFLYYDHDRKCEVIEDSKGMDNPLSRLKRKLVESSYGFAVELV